RAGTIPMTANSIEDSEPLTLNSNKLARVDEVPGVSGVLPCAVQNADTGEVISSSPTLTSPPSPAPSRRDRTSSGAPRVMSSGKRGDQRRDLRPTRGADQSRARLRQSSLRSSALMPGPHKRSTALVAKN